MTDLPTLDYSTDEALITSAETRASAALIAADSPVYYKGMQLRLTVSIKSLFLMLRKLDGAGENDAFRDERDTVILLYLCSQKASEWSYPVHKVEYVLQPLRARPTDWLAAIDEWADNAISPADLAEAMETIDGLWSVHHAPRAVPENTESDTIEKKA